MAKKPCKIENKTQPITLTANMAATEPADFHQPQVQNIYGCFLQPDVLKTWRFVNLTFCKPDVSDVLKPGVLKPDLLKPDVLWVYLKRVSVPVYNRGGNNYPQLQLIREDCWGASLPSLLKWRAITCIRKDLKVPSGQIGSEWEWYRWIAL